MKINLLRSGKIFTLSLVFGLVLFSSYSYTTVYAQTDAEIQCEPIVNNFTVSPLSLAKNTDKVNYNVTVLLPETCNAASGAGFSSWNIRIVRKDDAGNKYDFYNDNNFPINKMTFKKVGNFYKATFTYSNTPLKLSTDVTDYVAAVISPDVYYEDNEKVANTGLSKRVSLKGAESTNTNSNNNNANSNSNSGPPNNSLPNNAINTGISANFGSLDTNLGEFFNPIKPDSVPALITSIIRILFLLISIAAVITIIVAGFRMVLASGNETELTNAKKAITWAIIGLIVSLMSFSIVAIVQSLIKK